MNENGQYKVVWLDDYPENIKGLIDYVKNEKLLTIDIVKLADEAISRLLTNDGPDPDLLIVDLFLEEESGIDVAKKVKAGKPLVPIVAVTEMLNNYAVDIAVSLTKHLNPFSQIFTKGELATVDEKRSFVENILWLCKREHHRGEVTYMEPDFSQVEFYSLDGNGFQRQFDTKFLKGCGVERAGQEIEIVFDKKTSGSIGKVSMWVSAKTWPSDVKMNFERDVSKIMKDVDLDEIGEKFGSIMDDDE